MARAQSATGAASLRGLLSRRLAGPPGPVGLLSFAGQRPATLLVASRRPPQGPQPEAPPDGQVVCTVDGYGVHNDIPTRAPTRPGAYGVPETRGTGAIDRDQFLPPGSEAWPGWKKNAYLDAFRKGISGYVPDGRGGYRQVFDGVSDNIGGPADVVHLKEKHPGRVLFKLPGGAEFGAVNGMLFRVPAGLGCPRP